MSGLSWAPGCTCAYSAQGKKSARQGVSSSEARQRKGRTKPSLKSPKSRSGKLERATQDLHVQVSPRAAGDVVRDVDLYIPRAGASPRSKRSSSSSNGSGTTGAIRPCFAPRRRQSGFRPIPSSARSAAKVLSRGARACSFQSAAGCESRTTSTTCWKSTPASSSGFFARRRASRFFPRSGHGAR